jgi:hypothetical protein
LTPHPVLVDFHRIPLPNRIKGNDFRENDRRHGPLGSRLRRLCPLCCCIHNNLTVRIEKTQALRSDSSEFTIRSKEMKYWGLFLVLFFLCLPICAQAPAAATAADEASHQALREMRDAMVNALNKGDIDALISHVHKNVVFTAMNGEVCRGQDELRSYFNRMMKEPGHIVESLHVNPTVDHLTDLYAGTSGVSYGSSEDHYKLTNGQEFDVKARWSATVVSDNGAWKIASFQSAANIFDNPMLNKAKSALYLGAAGAGFIGLILGLLIGKRWGKSAT